MSRARLYVLIDAFEEDMRNVVERYILDHQSEAVTLGSEFAQAEKLRRSDVGDEQIAIVHYLFLRQCYDVLNRHRSSLPGDIAAEIRENTPDLDRLAPIRNRVMHGRPLRPDDPEIAISALRNFTSRYWVNTKQTLARLVDDPAWEPAFETLPIPNERILHNLPPADYDETGLIGRLDDVTKLTTLLKRRREPIITVTGEGGIGKTALALDVAYSIVDDLQSPFECVLWVSLKREMLTAYGVREISNAMRDMTEATETLGRVIDKSFMGSVKELAEMLQGITALIIVDNLESAQGSEVINLYDSLPASISYLFTSRLGIGEIERRYPLGPLPAAHAVQLFRMFAARRGQTRLASLSADRVQEVVVHKLRSSPLAIRWYVLSVEAGHEPASTLQDQTELLNFCVENVYEALSEKSRKALFIVNSLDRSVSFDELAILTDLPIDDLRRAVQEMSRGSLVVHEADLTGGVASRLSVSPAARLFLPRQPADALPATEILHREQAYLKGVERRRAHETERRLNPSVVRVRGPEDEPTAHLLRIAFSVSKKGDIDQAQEYIERARALNPDFWECDRVDAFLASTQRQRERATVLYRSALSKADSPESRAVVCHFFSGHLARAMHEQDLALPYAEEAHTLFQNADTALALGNLLVWNGKYAEGQELLEVAADEATGRAKLIALTGVVESWRRWSESLLERRLPAESFDKATAGFSVGADAIGRGFLDLRLASTAIDSAVSALKAISQPGIDYRDFEIRVAAVLESVARHVSVFRSTRNWRRFLQALSRWLRDTSPTAAVRTIADTLLQEDEGGASPAAPSGKAPSGRSAADRLIGEVISWAGQYGFIKHPDFPRNVFFHRGSLRDPEAANGLRGAVVYFDVDQDDDRGVCANNVMPITERA